MRMKNRGSGVTALYSIKRWQKQQWNYEYLEPERHVKTLCWGERTAEYKVLYWYVITRFDTIWPFLYILILPFGFGCIFRGRVQNAHKALFYKENPDQQQCKSGLCFLSGKGFSVNTNLVDYIFHLHVIYYYVQTGYVLRVISTFYVDYTRSPNILTST